MHMLAPAILLLSAILPALAEQQTVYQPETTSFAEWLLTHEMPERAQDEFLRELFHSYDPRQRDSLRICVATCMQRQGHWNDMVNWLEAEKPETPAGQELVRLHVGLASIDAGWFQQASDSLARAAECSQTRDAALYHLGRAQACLLETKGALTSWQSVHPDSPFGAMAQRLRNEIIQLELPRQRSGRLGGWLAVIPGLGYTYAGHPQTALSALLVLGLMGWSTERSFAAENPGLGAFCGFVTVGWYAGSIYGSVQAIHRFNDQELDSYRNHFK
jgi:hypothetical protein